MTLVSVFGASTGGAADSIPTRLARGEPADVIIVSAQALDALIAAGEVEPGSRVDLVLSRIGMAVRAGAPKPDIASVDALVRARARGRVDRLLGERQRHVSRDRAISAPRSRRGGRRGKAGASKASASAPSSRAATPSSASSRSASSLPIEGIDYVGPLPDEVQRVSTFSAGIAVGARSPAAARELVAFLASPALGPVVEKLRARAGRLRRRRLACALQRPRPHGLDAEDPQATRSATTTPRRSA